MKNTFRLYGVGGTGANIVNTITLQSILTGYPNCHKCIIDTSTSNVGDVENTFIIPGMNGAGSDRVEANRAFSRHKDRILTDFPPDDFNVVVFSSGGGSGAGMGPALLAELIARGHTAVGIVITSCTSLKEAKNTINCIGTLQNLSINVLNKPIVCSFECNGLNEQSLEVIDNAVKQIAMCLAILSSGENHGVDKADIRHLFAYDKVTKVTPQLTQLSVFVGELKPESLNGIKTIASASLLPNNNHSELLIDQLYSFFGYLPEGYSNATTSTDEPIYYVVSANTIPDQLAFFEEKASKFISHMDEIIKTTPFKPAATSNNGFIDD